MDILNIANMGLDSVEILMKVEQTFGISIPGEEAEKIITVGDFHNAVWRHLEGKHSDKRKSQSILFKLRQSLLDTFNLSTKDVKPGSCINVTNRTEVETVINHIIADMAGLELDEVTPAKKIGDDLGID